MKRYNLEEGRDWTMSAGDGTPVEEWTHPHPLAPVKLVANTDAIMEVTWHHDRLNQFGDYEYYLQYQMQGDDEIQTTGWTRRHTYTDMLLNHDSAYDWKIKVRRTWIRSHDRDAEAQYVFRESEWSQESTFNTDSCAPIPLILDLIDVKDDEMTVTFEFPRSTRYMSRVIYGLLDANDNMSEEKSTEFAHHNLSSERRTLVDLSTNRRYGV